MSIVTKERVYDPLCEVIVAIYNIASNVCLYLAKILAVQKSIFKKRCHSVIAVAILIPPLREWINIEYSSYNGLHDVTN